MALPAARLGERVSELFSFAAHKQWCPADRREGWTEGNAECGCGLEAARQSLLAAVAPPAVAGDPSTPLWELLAAELPERAEACRRWRRELGQARLALADAHSLLADLAPIEMGWIGNRASDLVSEAHDRAERLDTEVHALEAEFDDAAEAWGRAREARRLQLLSWRTGALASRGDEVAPALAALRSQLAAAQFLVELGSPLQVRMAREAGLAIERALLLLEDG